MKQLFKNIGLLVVATLAVTIVREILEIWINYDFDYVSGFAVGSIYYSVKV